jgi:hypothetical protein
MSMLLSNLCFAKSSSMHHVSVVIGITVHKRKVVVFDVWIKCAHSGGAGLTETNI